jgi:hypothetical protein
VPWKLVVARALYGWKGLFENPEQWFRTLELEEGDRILEVGCPIGIRSCLQRVSRDLRTASCVTRGRLEGPMSLYVSERG